MTMVVWFVVYHIYIPGLALLGCSTVAFGYRKGLAACVCLRIVQGIGGGCTLVAGNDEYGFSVEATTITYFFL